MERRSRSSGMAGTGVYAGFIALLVVVGGLVALAAQNTDSVTVRLFEFEWTAPLIAVLLAAMLLTVILDEAIGAVWRRRRRRIMAERNELEQRRAEGATSEAGAASKAAL